MFKKNEKEESYADLEFFVIYDSKVRTYREPMFAPNRDSMLRDLGDFYRDPQNARNQLQTNAEDFKLFSVGNYTKRTGAILTWQPEHVANLHEIKAIVQRTTAPTPELSVNQKITQ